MPNPTEVAFLVVQIAYWIALATWFGAVLFSIVAAPIIFRTIRDADPTLPKVISVNLEGQHSTLLAGTIMANLLHVITRVQLVCAISLLPVIIIQWFLISLANLLPPILRSASYVGAAVFLLYYWRVVWPRSQQYRQEYIDHADEPEVANPALDQFDRYNREGDIILMIMLALLLLMLLFSGDIGRASTTFTFK